MSTLMNLTEVSTQILALPMADGGFLDWVNTKTGEATTTLRGVSVLLAIVFVIVAAVVSRMAMARVIIAAIAAGFFVWVVFNVTSLQDRVDKEMAVDTSTAVVRDYWTT